MLMRLLRSPDGCSGSNSRAKSNTLPKKQKTMTKVTVQTPIGGAR
jgi:hypothetical protein